ncbi:MAG TPA: hypothetical protein VGJ53_08465 [Micromonosporaceae bacterium]|jgi:hypothetical protein
MAEEYGCVETRPLLVELATGVLTGHERGQALRHVDGCPACRRELGALSQVADSLLLLARGAEPPPGFEAKVMARLATDATPEPVRPTTPEPVSTAAPEPVSTAAPGPGDVQPDRPAPARPHPPGLRRVPPGPSRWRRWLTRPVLAVAVAVVVAAGLGASVVQWRTADDRMLAERYRQTLAVGGGRYLTAAQLTTEAGTPAGTVFLYEGRPSWLVASVTAAPADGAYAMTVVDRNGVSHPVGVCAVADGRGTSGYALYRHVADVAAVQLRGPGGDLLAART